jgi:catechol 2,3-dioxygenase-like lactoylglutathione lyase family enzyme
MISQVSHVTIPVKDQDRALKFYTEKLGFQLLVDLDFGEGQRWIELKIPSAETLVTLFTPKDHENRIGTFSNITFSTKDVHQTYKDLKNKGVVFTVPPTKESWGEYAIFNDEDNNSFCLSKGNDAY